MWCWTFAISLDIVVTTVAGRSPWSMRSGACDPLTQFGPHFAPSGFSSDCPLVGLLSGAQGCLLALLVQPRLQTQSRQLPPLPPAVPHHLQPFAISLHRPICRARRARNMFHSAYYFDRGLCACDCRSSGGLSFVVACPSH